MYIYSSTSCCGTEDDAGRRRIKRLPGCGSACTKPETKIWCENRSTMSCAAVWLLRPAACNAVRSEIFDPLTRVSMHVGCTYEYACVRACMHACMNE